MKNLPTIFLIVLIMVLSSYGQEQETVGPFTAIETAVCSNVEDRTPIGEADTFSSDIERVYLWSKVIGAVDSTLIKHVWVYQDKEIATVELPVKSSSWRTWSYKTILPEWIGDWEVKIVDAEGTILKSVTFKIEKSEPEPPREAPLEKPSDSI